MIKLQLNPEPRMLAQFAWISLFAFPLIALLLWWKFGLPAGWAYGIAALGPATVLGHLAGLPAVPLGVFRGMVLITWPIGLVVFPVIVAVIYYGVFTPMGLAFRLMGRDVLKRRPDPGQKSYWLDRGPPRPAASYFKLY